MAKSDFEFAIRCYGTSCSVTYFLLEADITMWNRSVKGRLEADIGSKKERFK